MTLNNSIFSRIKYEYYDLTIEESWLLRSLDAPEKDLLELIASATEDEVFIRLKKKDGLQRSENVNEAVNPAYQGMLEANKNFWLPLAELSDKTGLTNNEILMMMPNYEEIEKLRLEIKQLREAASEELDKGKRQKLEKEILSLSEAMQQVTKEKKNEFHQKVSTEDIQKINELFEAKTQAEEEYYYALISYCLSNTRILKSQKNPDGTETNESLKVEITAENIKNLHEDFYKALRAFFVREERGENTLEGKQKTIAKRQ